MHGWARIQSQTSGSQTCLFTLPFTPELTSALRFIQFQPAASPCGGPFNASKLSQQEARSADAVIQHHYYKHLALIRWLTRKISLSKCLHGVCCSCWSLFALLKDTGTPYENWTLLLSVATAFLISCS